MATLLHRLEQRLDDLSLRMDAAMSDRLRRSHRRVSELTAAVLRQDPRRRLAHTRGNFEACRVRLDRTVERMILAAGARLSALDAQLHSLSPLAVLDRGYALVLDSQGGLIRSATQVAAGDSVLTRLSDGAFTSRVETATPKQI